ncbi:MAG: manganese-binding transcriptional regulator MntR [Pikeienuella sp.]|uniref:manganese-binding transcriptional regulator MntR n=1 Tax=Pikeienuella sp. TaxID=2831957 RepID=UPI00391A5117
MRDVKEKEADADPAEASAGGFRATRDAHRTEIVEDYVELVAELIETMGEARPVDIAARMGVTQPTVAKNLARLMRDGYVTRERYRSVFLTEEGAALARACRERHRIVVEFLLILGLDPETAEQDAEGIEHHVSEATLARFRAFIDERATPVQSAATSRATRS